MPEERILIIAYAIVIAVITRERFFHSRPQRIAA